MTDLIALTEAKTIARYARAEERAIRSEGFGASPVALKVTKDCVPVLIEFIQERLESPSVTLEHHKFEGGELRSLLAAVGHLSPEILALSSLHCVLRSIGQGEDLRGTALNLGTVLNGELWAAGLLTTDKKLHARIERSVRKRHGAVKQRQQAARSMAAKAGYKLEGWSKEQRLRAGHLFASFVFDALPEVFYTYHAREGKKTYIYPGIKDEAIDIATEAVKATIANNPFNLPCTTPPLPWTDLHVGGYPDARLKGRVTLLRKHSKMQGAQARAAIRNGTMKPMMDAINSLQSVAWTVNKPVLDVLNACVERKIAVKGLPRPEPYEKPAKLKPWDEMTKEEQKAWRYRANKIEEQNRGLIASRVLFAADVETAQLMAGEERFWTPFNADWRGRVYPLPHFNFQRDDRIRGLFLFADGEPIGVEGLRWLKIHVANCGGFNKIDKAPLEERIAWVNNWLSLIDHVSRDPLHPSALAMWTRADSPFLFLAACFELSNALAVGPSYVTRLPVSWDGACNGLQHLAAMTRDADTAALVNLVPCETPQDVYQHVADEVRTRVEYDANHGEETAQKALAYGITRKLVKRNVMTFSYASEKYGMSQQHREDTMRPLEIEVLAGERDVHPFGEDNGREGAKYLADITYDAIQSTVTLPAEAMGFLQSLARALAHEGKPLCWTTPAGLPWCNAYYAPTFTRVRLWLHDSHIRLTLAHDTKEIAKDKAANAVAANFTHACDAAHLLLTTNACVAEGITQIATVHDSYGCLASQAGRFNEVIREQFVNMYNSHDVLAEVFLQASRDLTQHNQHRLPDMVDAGPLNIQEVLNAQYAFA